MVSFLCVKAEFSEEKAKFCGEEKYGNPREKKAEILRRKRKHKSGISSKLMAIFPDSLRMRELKV
jgi:hypothetical protein